MIVNCQRDSHLGKRLGNLRSFILGDNFFPCQLMKNSIFIFKKGIENVIALLDFKSTLLLP